MKYTENKMTRDLNNFNIKFNKVKYFNCSLYYFTLGNQNARVEVHKNGKVKLVFIDLKAGKEVTRNDFNNLLAYYA